MSGARRRALDLAGESDRGQLLDALAAEAAGGDDDASADLVWAVLRLGLARPGVRRYLLRESDVELAEQCAIVTVATRIRSFRGEAAFTTWLYRVAANEARQIIRAEARHRDRREFGDVEAHADRFVGTVSSMIADRSVVEAAVAGLAPDQREALLLREEQGLSYAEIAERRGVPVNTAKSHVRRARVALAATLVDVLAGPGEI